jgi:hypothetical protein
MRRADCGIFVFHGILATRRTRKAFGARKLREAFAAFERLC